MSAKTDPVCLPPITAARDEELRAIPVVGEHLDAIRALCREFGVARLEVFGSVVTDRFDDESDVDFIVRYPRDYDFGHFLTRYFELKARLECLLGRPVDLVMATAIRKWAFIAEARQTRRLLYAA